MAYFDNPANASTPWTKSLINLAIRQVLRKE